MQRNIEPLLLAAGDPLPGVCTDATRLRRAGACVARSRPAVRMSAASSPASTYCGAPCAIAAYSRASLTSCHSGASISSVSPSSSVSITMAPVAVERQRATAQLIMNQQKPE